ncbi:MAG: lipopolysaccharide biosynthesis protein [Bacteroidia bacterium]
MVILKQLSIYTLVGIIGAGINFFVMPVLSHYLAPADYGLLSLFNTYVTILIPIVSVSAYSLISVDYFKQKNKEIFARQFTSIQVIPFFNSLLLGILIWMFYGRVADDLELGDTGIKWGFIILLVTFLTIYFDQFIQFLVLQKKAGAFAFYSLLRVAIEVSLTLYFIIIKGWNWEGRMYSWLITSLAFFFIGFLYFYKQGFIKGPVQYKYIKEGLIFGAPLVLHGIGKFVVNQSDRLFIVKMVSMEETGIYNIGYTVGTLVLIAVNAFFGFYSPYMMERLTDMSEIKKLQIVRLGYYYLLGCIVLLLLILLLAPPFFKLLINPLYHDGIKYVFWIALGYCFWGGYMLFSGFIFYLKKSKILGWLAIFNVITNLFFNYVLIKQFGAIGAAYATALSFFLLMLLIAVISQKLMPMPWKQIKEANSTAL